MVLENSANNCLHYVWKILNQNKRSARLRKIKK
jgi:hypothetical protein